MGAGMAVVVAVVKETAPNERRVALAPEAVGRLQPLGIEVRVEADAGAAAWFTDAAYVEAGARIGDLATTVSSADLVLTVGRPSAEVLELLRPGQALIGMLQPLADPDYAVELASAKLTAISMDGLARTISRAQSMDVLSSQSSVAGYRAALVAASSLDKYFPLLVTAAGTARPAEVLVLGAGVAGLQAIATARRLGAVVKAYDVRPQSAGEVASLGGTFLTMMSVAAGAGEGGYARALTAAEQAALQAELNSYIAKQDVVITTAQVPGRRPPVLVTAEAVAAMKPGAVIVDIAASPLGGNVSGSVPDQTVVTANGVTIIGAPNLPAEVPTAASAAFSRNMCAVLAHLIPDGTLRIDPTDEIQAGIVITHEGRVIHSPTLALLNKDRPAGVNL
jgi:NAD(P) transhydrogenase subunit alpha